MRATQRRSAPILVSDASYLVQQPACPSCRVRFLLSSAMRPGPREMTVYRVSRGPVNTWRIYAGAAREPLASFNDKSTAVRYAMRLARGEVSWSSLASSAVATLLSPIAEGITPVEAG